MYQFKTKDGALAHLQAQVVWGNAAGVLRDAAYVRKLADVGVPNIMFGSITMNGRSGNPGDNFYYEETTGNSLNALGLPNRGFEDYLDGELPRAYAAAQNRARLWVSISAGDAFSYGEYYRMAHLLKEHGVVDVIEGNFSCPNVVVDGKPKPIVCADPPTLQMGIQALREGAGKLPIAVKIAPTLDEALLEKTVALCFQYDVNYLVVSNTVGGQMLYHPDGSRVIAMEKGGLGGRALIPIVSKMLDILGPQLHSSLVHLVATGGVQDGKVAYDYLKRGAKGFAFNTLLTRPGGGPHSVVELIFGDEARGIPGLLDHMVEGGLPA